MNRKHPPADSVSPTDSSSPDSSSLLRASGSIAVATLVSRATGFIRTVLVGAMLGPAIFSAFNTAYTLPSMVAEALLGAVLTAIVIPVLARAEREDADGGKEFINRIFTLSLTILIIGTLVALLAAPLLTSATIGENGKVDRQLTTLLTYLLLPEILFYGLSALFMALLNLRGNFKPGAWAPVANNIVQIATLIVYALLPGGISLNPAKITDAHLLVLGVGTTVGVIIQAFILVPALRAADVQLRWRWGIDARLKKFGNMALAIIFYVVVLQIGWAITTRIAAHETVSGPGAYAQHWQLLQLPYGILGVTILTAIMPRLARNAAADDTSAVVNDLSVATRLTLIALVPISAFMTFFGPTIGLALFNFGNFDAIDASQVGSVLAWGAFTIIPYSMTLVQLRVFYAREDAWTPTAIAVGITMVKIALSLVGPALFDNPEYVVRWLAFANGCGYLAGALVGHYLLRHRLGYQKLHDVRQTTLTTLAAAVISAAVVWGISLATGLDQLATAGGKLGSLSYLLIVGIVTLGITYCLLTLAKIPDVLTLGTSVQSLLGRFIPALAPKSIEQSATKSADTLSQTELTVQFSPISDDSPYAGQLDVVRRFDRGTASWQTIAIHSGGAAGNQNPAFDSVDRTLPGTISPSGSEYLPPRSRYLKTTTTFPPLTIPLASEPAMTTPHEPTAQQLSTQRGPALVPGAAVAGGRYRLLQHHGGAFGLEFWRARDSSLDRDVALTFVDAQQSSRLPATDPDSPQAILTRTLRLGRIESSGMARVIDVVPGASGGIIVAEWVPGSSLTAVSLTSPSPIGAARAVRALAAAAEMVHRTGAALSIDHPHRIRISTEGNAVYAFPGVFANASKANDVKGLGAVLNSLLLAQWPIASTPADAADTSTVGGLPLSPFDDAGAPPEPRAIRAEVPFEISAVTARALAGNSGIQTAATVQHVLDQATVLDLKTDMIQIQNPGSERKSALTSDRAPRLRQPKKPTAPSFPDRPASIESLSTATPRSKNPNTKNVKTLSSQLKTRRTPALIIGSILLALLLIIGLIVGLTKVFGANGDSAESILNNTSSRTGPIPAILKGVYIVPKKGESTRYLQSIITGQSPSWSTGIYNSSHFDGTKEAVGVNFKLDRANILKTITVETSTPGIEVDIRAADQSQPTLNRTILVAQGEINSRKTTFTLKGQERPALFIMIWITKLPQSNDGYQASITKVSVTS